MSNLFLSFSTLHKVICYKFVSLDPDPHFFKLLDSDPH